VLFVLRYVVPAVVCIAGFVMFAVLPTPTNVAAGSALLGAGLSIALMNLMYRVGAKGDEERQAEEDAREFYARHGRWPD
jgi:hypothetical protein